MKHPIPDGTGSCDDAEGQRVAVGLAPVRCQAGKDREHDHGDPEAEHRQAEQQTDERNRREDEADAVGRGDRNLEVQGLSRFLPGEPPPALEVQLDYQRRDEAGHAAQMGEGAPLLVLQGFSWCDGGATGGR